MLLGGLWPGASWSFVVWGAYQGFWLIVERLAGKRAFYRSWPRPLRIALTMVLIMIGWVFFRAPDLGAAGSHLAAMVGLTGARTAVLEIGRIHLLTGLVALFVVWATPTTQVLLERARLAWAVLLQILFLLSLLHLHHESHVPFLYFRF